MVLVTGGIGFIGSHLCRQLVEEGDDVIIYDNFSQGNLDLLKKLRMPDIADRVRFIKGDITDFDHVLKTLRGNDIDGIIHTAAITFIPAAIENPAMAFRVNTLGSFNLLEASRVADIGKFVYISTTSTYGDFKYTPADEEHPLDPKDIYGATKAAADRIAMSYYRTYNLPVSVIRTSSVYGPGDLEKRVTKNFIENALQGTPMELQGGGAQRRDFSYVKDVANGMVLALKSRKANGEVFNISGGKDYSIRDLAETVKGFIPHAELKEVGARAVDLNRGQLDISKARKLLGYSPEYGLRDGIKDYIKWIVEVYAPLFNLKIVNKPVIS